MSVAIALGCAVCAPAPGARSPLGLLAMVPPPASGDCFRGSAARKKHDDAMTAFERAYNAAEKQAQQAGQAVMAREQKTAVAGGMGLRADAMFKLQEWMTAPGGVNLRQRAADLFNPLQDDAVHALSPIAQRLSDCDKTAGDPNSTCDENKIADGARPVFVKWAGDIHQAWREYIASVKRDITWTSRPLPPGLDAQNPEVQMQLYSMRGQGLQDVKMAAAEADRLGCMETVHMSAALVQNAGRM